MKERASLLKGAIAVALVFGASVGCREAQPAGKVSLIEPADGARVISPFYVRMRAEGVTIEPAGQVREGAGHHHIIIDANQPALNQPIPSDPEHLHYGTGQTEVALDLVPGEHTLRLLFAKGDHVPYDPPITATIKVTVTERRRVFFTEPGNGAQVTSPFTVKMGADGLVVEPTAQGVLEGHGHHHIVVDGELPSPGQPIPADDQHRHFGNGQTETVLDLPPGEHTLRLAFAKGDHVPYDPSLTDSIKITVVR